MKRTIALLALVAAGCIQTPEGAPDIQITDARAMPTLAGKTVTAAYLTIANRGSADDALIAVTSSTGPATVHSTSMAGGIMRMRELDRLALPAGATVKLEPGATHLMLTELREPLAAGGTIELGLDFEKSADLTVTARIQASSGERM